jgi:hypothetical protein
MAALKGERGYRPKDGQLHERNALIRGEEMEQ